jgi:GMP synthase (glutamine-hydrolysing)
MSAVNPMDVIGADGAEGADGLENLLGAEEGVQADVELAGTSRPVLVVDFGAQYAQLIARRVREASVYSEIVAHSITAAEVTEKNPIGIVLSGGPSSVYAEGAPTFDPAIFDLGVDTGSATASR